MKRDMIEANVSNLVSFVMDVCENNIYTIPFEEDKEEIFVSLKDLYQEYDLWCRQNDTKGRKSSRETLHEALKKELGIKKSQGSSSRTSQGVYSKPCSHATAFYKGLC